MVCCTGLRRTNHGLTMALNKYKLAIDELHPQVMELKQMKHLNQQLENEIARMTELQSSDVLILTNEMKRLRSQQYINVENETFAIECRMALDDCLLRQQEVKNSRNVQWNTISKLKNAISSLHEDCTMHEECARESMIRETTGAKQLSNARNELSGVLRMHSALEDECDERKRKSIRLGNDLKDVEKERDHLQERLLVVEHRMTELLASTSQTLKDTTNDLKNVFQQEMEEQKILLREQIESNEKMRLTMKKIRKSSVTAAAKKSGELSLKINQALEKTEKELRATVGKLVAAEEASETAFTCMTCLEIMTKPVTCIPCGHSYCETCLSSSIPSYGRYEQKESGNRGKVGHCPECAAGGASGASSKKTEYYIENQLLENLCARYVFRKQAIASLKNMTQALSKKVRER